MVFAIGDLKTFALEFQLRMAQIRHDIPGTECCVSQDVFTRFRLRPGKNLATDSMTIESLTDHRDEITDLNAGILLNAHASNAK